MEAVGLLRAERLSYLLFLIYQSRFIATGAVSSWGICIPQLISVDEIGEFLWRVLSGRKRLRLAKWVLSVVVWIMMTSKSMWIQLVLYIGTVHVSVALFRNFLMWYVSNSYYSFLFFFGRGEGDLSSLWAISVWITNFTFNTCSYDTVT